MNVRTEHQIKKMLALVHDIHQKTGLSTRNDQGLEEMKEKIDIKAIKQHVDERESKAESLSSDKN